MRHRARVPPRLAVAAMAPASGAAIAEDRGLVMPSFVAYFAYACALLLPLLAVVARFML